MFTHRNILDGGSIVPGPLGDTHRKSRMTDVQLENLDSIERILRFVEAKTGQGS